MAPSLSSQSLATVTAILLLPLLVYAQGSTGGGRMDSGQCPNNTEDTMVYSPFKPYFKFPMFSGDNQKCWVAADCLFEAAGESRKQQFAATALVMGLIPLTLKDIAWPEKRLIHVTKKLNWIVEILVLALGLVPLETGSREKTLQNSAESNRIAKACWKLRRATVVLWIIVCTIAMIAAYAGIVIMEIYSKRSALGCPFPIFVAAWYVIALIPASIHAFFASVRRVRTDRKNAQMQNSRGLAVTANDPKHGDGASTPETSEVDPERKKKIVSAIQGADEDWPVQIAWGVYYIAGTLVFTSIMAVTVVELVCWVGLGFFITGCQKLLAFFLCLVFEKTGVVGEGILRA